MAEKALRRKRVEEKDEEKIIDFYNLPDRREHFQKFIGDLSELTEKYLVKGAPEKSPGMSYFAYYFSNLPSTRHEAHWQFHSFVLLEILQVLRSIQESLGGVKP